MVERTGNPELNGPDSISFSNAPDTDVPLPRWVRAADVLVCALIFLALYVAIDGGAVLRPFGLRVSLRSEWRVLGWALALFAVRHYVFRRTPLPRRIVRAIAGAAREAGSLADDLAAAKAQPQIPRSASLPRRLVQVVAVLAVYAALTAAMTWPQAKFVGETVVPDTGDPLLSTWRLAWVAHQLPRDPLRLFDGNIFHPERHTLAYSDSMVVPSLMGAPLVWLGVHPLVVYNVLFLSAFVLSGAAMFLLVRSLTRHTGAALFAGFVFAFLPYRYMHYSHLELQMAQWMPLCLWAFHRTVRTGRLADGLVTGAFFALQTLSSLYYGIFFGTYLAVVGTVILAGSGRDRMRAAIRPLAAGAVLAVLLTIPFTLPYFAARDLVGERRQEEIEIYSATPQNYLAAPYWNKRFGIETHKRGSAERELFQGFVVPLVAVVGAWPPLSAARMAYALGGIVAFETSLGYNGLTYRFLHEHVLPYRGLRVPSRMSIVVGLSLAIFLGFGAARIARISRPGWAAAALIALAAGVMLEYRTTVRLRPIWRYPPPVYEAVRSSPPSVLLELPLVDPDTILEPIYMYFSTFHWQKLVNGYSGFSPPSHLVALEWMSTFPDDATMAAVRARGVDFVIVHGAFYRKLEDYERLVAKLDARSDVSLVGVTRWQERDTRVYRVDDPSWTQSSGTAVSGTAGGTPPR